MVLKVTASITNVTTKAIGAIFFEQISSLHSVLIEAITFVSLTDEYGTSCHQLVFKTIRSQYPKITSISNYLDSSFGPQNIHPFYIHCDFAKILQLLLSVRRKMFNSLYLRKNCTIIEKENV